MLKSRVFPLVLCALGMSSVPNGANGQAFSFQFIDQEIFPMTLGEIVWGDLNRDGLLDLVVTGLAACWRACARACARGLTQGIVIA